MVGTDSRDEQVHATVIVVVGRRDAVAIPDARQTSLLRDVFEFHAAEVMVKTVAIFWSVLFEKRKGCAVGEEDIGEAVAIIVERGYSTHHRLDDMFLRRGAVLQDEIDPGVGSHVLEADRRYRTHQPG